MISKQRSWLSGETEEEEKKPVKKNVAVKKTS
jgi:hypothetical protein